MAAIQTLDNQEKVLEASPAPDITSAEAVAYLHDLHATWADAEPSARAELARAIYQKIEGRGSEFVGVTLSREG